jgi:phosphoribosylanthranilate isomerase
VAAAIAAVRPDGVDVASGVESAPGVKHAAAVERFVRAARDAAASIHAPSAAPSLEDP